jgi:hypothetical protein
MKTEDDDKTLQELLCALVGVIILLGATGGFLGWLALQLSPWVWQALFLK